MSIYCRVGVTKSTNQDLDRKLESNSLREKKNMLGIAWYLVMFVLLKGSQGPVPTFPPGPSAGPLI